MATLLKLFYITTPPTASFCQTLYYRCDCNVSSRCPPCHSRYICHTVARLKTLTAQCRWVSSKSQNLQPFTDNVDVSLWAKYSRVGQQTIKILSLKCFFLANTDTNQPETEGNIKDSEQTLLLNGQHLFFLYLFLYSFDLSGPLNYQMKYCQYGVIHYTINQQADM